MTISVDVLKSTALNSVPISEVLDYSQPYEKLAFCVGALGGDVPPVPGLREKLGVSGLKPEGMGVFYQAPAPSLLGSDLLDHLAEDPSYKALLSTHAEPDSDGKPDRLREATKTFLEAHDLEALARDTRERAQGATSETQGVVDRAVATLEFLRDTALVRRGMKKPMGLEEMVSRGTGGALENIEPSHLTEVQEQLRAALAVVLGDAVKSLPFHDAMGLFRANPALNFPRDEVQSWFDRQTGKLERLTCERVLPHLDLEPLGLDSSVVEFGRLVTTFQPGVSSLHLYTGSEANGHPQFDGELFIGIGMGESTLNDPMYTYTLAHEAYPGHHLHAAFLDAASRKGILPSMSAFGVMPGPALALAEGWAMASPFALYSEGEMSAPTRAAMMSTYLGALGGLYSARRLFLDKADKGTVAAELVKDFGYNPDRVMGALNLPTDFQMAYRPIYPMGIRAVMDAIRSHGLPAVAQAILTPKSPIDLNLFKENFRS